MPTPYGERAIADALAHGCAILKFISPNDAGLTRGHQCGYYLPKNVWQIYTPNPPVKGVNSESLVTVLWQDGRETQSCVHWYGRTKSEYRLTRFGHDFPWLSGDSVGDLLMLIPVSHEKFLGYVLDHEEDVEEVTAALGVEVIDTWGVYQAGAEQSPETEDACVNRKFRLYTQALADFPTTEELSRQAREILMACFKGFAGLSVDDRLWNLVQAEYSLFKIIERQVCQPEIQRLFKSIDDFLKTAQPIMQRRKSRAGRSLENHFEFLLKQANVPCDIRSSVDGRPDVIIPSATAYCDPNYPTQKLCMVGVKTTCKDRWRQVLNEARRVQNKHILTFQRGISKKQLQEMNAAGVTLIVPERLQKEYPKGSGIRIVTVRDFMASVRGLLA